MAKGRPLCRRGHWQQRAPNDGESSYRFGTFSKNETDPEGFSSALPLPDAAVAALGNKHIKSPEIRARGQKNSIF